MLGLPLKPAECGAHGRARTRRTLGDRQLLIEDFTVNKFEGPGDYYVEIAALAGNVWDAPKTPAESPIEFDLRPTGRAEESTADLSGLIADPPPAKPPRGPVEQGELLGGEPEEGDRPTALVLIVFAMFAVLTGLALGVLGPLRLGGGPRPRRP